MKVFVWDDIVFDRAWSACEMETKRVDSEEKKATKNLPAVVKVMLVGGAR